MDISQQIADEATNLVMREIFGKQFTECDNIEDVDKLNRAWEYFNEEFFETIFHYLEE